MDSKEYIIESQLVTGSTKCTFFGKKQYVYFYVHYTSKTNWLISSDTLHYNPNCNCYRKNLNKLFKKQISQVKSEMLMRIKLKYSLLHYKKIEPTKEVIWRD